MCKGCPLIPNPTRTLARTETRGGPSQPHPQPQPARKSERKQRWRKFPTIPPPRLGENQEKSCRIVLSRCVEGRIAIYSSYPKEVFRRLVIVDWNIGI